MRATSIRLLGKVFLRSMNTVTSRQVSPRQLAVPNLLTYARIAAVPAVVACLYLQGIFARGPWVGRGARFLFISAGGNPAPHRDLPRKTGEQSPSCPIVRP